jgi:GNAT superfamily N-acetyltransferase
MDATEIRRIEELSINAWPALRQVVIDGWLLRFAEGYTRRCNSVQPLSCGTQELQRKIAMCGEEYARQGLPLIFKMTAAAQPRELDGVLARSGYKATAYTSVQTCQIDGRSSEAWRSVALWGRPPAEWLDRAAHFSRTSKSHRQVLSRILASIVQETWFGAIFEDGEMRACGLAVREGTWVGLFDIVTSPKHRRRGHARRLVDGLLDWAHSRGATHAYLQVMLDNDPALRLYERLGFQEAYQYWYRRRG